MKHKFPYNWTLKDAVFTKDKGKVFTTFSCGGGSTMGYKLAGYDVIGCNEIDPKMMAAYIKNHNPKYPYLEPIQEFKLREDLPEELYDLDILDGSPPCSSFSISGARQRDWGKEKVFREGQAMQVLDTLFFDYIDLAEKLQPKVCIAENVKGLMMGEAKEYVRQIYKSFDKAGYYCQHFLLDASTMGVPQKRERVFFVAFRKDLAQQFLVQKDMFTYSPNINLVFKEPKIVYSEFADYLGPEISDHCKIAWEHRQPHHNNIADSKREAGFKESNFNLGYVHPGRVLATITGKGRHTYLVYDKGIHLSDTEMIKTGTFPLDYDFKPSNPGYLIGMSVPPVMVAQISSRIYDQWLSKI